MKITKKPNSFNDFTQSQSKSNIKGVLLSNIKFIKLCGKNLKKPQGKNLGKQK